MCVCVFYFVGNGWFALGFQSNPSKKGPRATLTKTLFPPPLLPSQISRKGYPAQTTRPFAPAAKPRASAAAKAALSAQAPGQRLAAGWGQGRAGQRVGAWGAWRDGGGGGGVWKGQAPSKGIRGGLKVKEREQHLNTSMHVYNCISYHIYPHLSVYLYVYNLRAAAQCRRPQFAVRELFIRTNVSTKNRVSLYVCMQVCMHACMYVCT